MLRRLGLTMLMVTHDLPYALQLCDRAVVMSAGRIAADGPIEEILADATLMAAHRLELPLGFDLGLMRRLRREAPGRAGPGTDRPARVGCLPGRSRAGVHSTHSPTEDQLAYCPRPPPPPPPPAPPAAPPGGAAPTALFLIGILIAAAIAVPVVFLVLGGDDDDHRRFVHHEAGDHHHRRRIHHHGGSSTTAVHHLVEHRPALLRARPATRLHDLVDHLVDDDHAPRPGCAGAGLTADANYPSSTSPAASCPTPGRGGAVGRARGRVLPGRRVHGAGPAGPRLPDRLHRRPARRCASTSSPTPPATTPP